MTKTLLEIPLSADNHQRLVLALANLCYQMFRVGGAHIAAPTPNLIQIATIPDSRAGGVLHAAFDVRTLLSASLEGRQALLDLGFDTPEAI